MLAQLVQTATGTSNLASTVVAFSNNTVSGNSIIVICGNSSTTSGDVSGVTDTQGNVYTKALTNANATLGDLEIWYTSGIIGGANTITVAYTAGVACGVIIREYYGFVYANALDKQVSTTGNSATPSSGNTTSLTQTNELLIGAAVIPLTSTPTAGGNFVNLATVGAPLVVAVAAEDLFVTTGGIQSATFNVGLTMQWVCGIATFFLSPTGTTTSTSSTSASTFSTSSTSSSISSTSSSISSTSTSLSTSSTSLSTSSTSSSVSSTSSSTSSTSISSTSSSTSISSTSTSISSTSFSSTSQSSTSSSTSISSTSSSISSTSSSISSTSSSVSSTSFSSTSSSSSTSTTTVPYLTDTYTDSLVLPYPKLVQSTSGTNAAGATATTSTSAFGSSTTAGNAILVAMINDGSNGSVTSVTDTQGNVYTKVATVPPGDTVTAEVWAAFNIKAGASNIVTANQGFNDGIIFAQEWSGLLPSPLDQQAGAKGAGASMTVNTPATLYSSEVVFVAGEMDIVGTNALSVGAGYSNFTTLSSNSLRGAVESNITTTSGGQTASMVMTAQGGASWRLAVATFKATSPSNFTVPQYSNVSGDDGDYFIERGSEYMVRTYKSQHQNNTDSITFTWKGRSTESSLVSPIFVQIYNVNSAQWETLAIANTVPADTDFQAVVTQSTNLSNYYDSTNIVSFRSYQRII